MALRRGSVKPLSALPAIDEAAPEPSAASGALHSGQRLAKPGLFGRSSNSSPQTAQVLIGNAIDSMITRLPKQVCPHCGKRMQRHLYGSPAGFMGKNHSRPAAGNL